MDPKALKHRRFYKNPIEIFKEGSLEVARETTQEMLKPLATEALNQIFGRQNKRFSGEMQPGQSLEMHKVLTGKQETEDALQKSRIIELTLFEEEKVLVERRSRELRVQIEAIQVEVTKIAKLTPQLAREVEIAAIQAPVDVNTYELFFLKHLFEFIKSYREHIENSHIWLQTVNSRSRKKNVWGQNYKKYGARYLRSGEHYSGRSAA